jgi:hypothetical protein
VFWADFLGPQFMKKIKVRDQIITSKKFQCQAFCFCDKNIFYTEKDAILRVYFMKVAKKEHLITAHVKLSKIDWLKVQISHIPLSDNP